MRSLAASTSLVLAGCVLVDNPNHLALDEASEASESSTTQTSSGASSTSETTSETTAADTSSSESGPDCPPGKAGTLGCQCIDGVLCDEGLVCSEGVCSTPLNCPPDQAVGVAVSLGNNAFTPELQVGICAIASSVQLPDTLVIDAAACDGPVNAFSLAITPFPSDLLPAEWMDTSGEVFLRAVAQDEVYLRIGGIFELWLTHASSLDPGDPVLADYPVALSEGLGDCPATMEPCGLGERRGLQAGDELVFDGHAQTLLDGSSLWVAEAELSCGTPRYTFAWIRP